MVPIKIVGCYKAYFIRSIKFKLWKLGFFLELYENISSWKLLVVIKHIKTETIKLELPKLRTPSKILFCNLKPSNSVRSSGLITKQLVIMHFFPRYLISFSFQNWKLINKSVTQQKASTLKHNSTPKLLQLWSNTETFYMSTLTAQLFYIKKKLFN